jgi:23S rRNA (uracil1939-C5)-methyltransferase
VGRLDGRPVFVAGLLPGERALVRVTAEREGAFRGEAVELVSPSPLRVASPCPHFGPCGGCALQHLEAGACLEWKRGLVVQALARRGLEGVPVAAPVTVPEKARRRAVLAAARSGGRVDLGFHQARSHAIVDLSDCRVLHPDLFALLAPLREVLALVLEDGARAGATLLLTETGIDLLLDGPAPPDLAAREALAAFAEDRDLARLSWRAGDDPLVEPVAQRRAPLVRFAGVAVAPPPGGFVQPTAEGKAALVAGVLRRLPEGATRLADLYAGCGTFTFALAARARVHAVEGEAAALAALEAAARASAAGRVTAEQRDLARRPLLAEELNPYDCVVFDPPRAGAKAQAEQLALSGVPAAIAVSCNPHTFARDARLLADGGFALEEVTPIDQFPWTGHLELVARFRR